MHLVSCVCVCVHNAWQRPSKTHRRAHKHRPSRRHRLAHAGLLGVHELSIQDIVHFHHIIDLWNSRTDVYFAYVAYNIWVFSLVLLVAERTIRYNFIRKQLPTLRTEHNLE